MTQVQDQEKARKEFQAHEQALKEAEKDPQVYTLKDGDVVRLENGLYTAGEWEDGLGFDETTGNYVDRIPLYGEIYPQGIENENDPLVITTNDVIKYGDEAFVIVPTHTVELEDDYRLVNVKSLPGAIKAATSALQALKGNDWL